MGTTNITAAISPPVGLGPQGSPAGFYFRLAHVTNSQPEKLYAMAFFDGQNLFRHAMDAFGHYHPNYDPVKLHRDVCLMKGWIPNLVRFYTGVPDPNESPIWAAYWSNRVIALKRAGVVVTTRPIRYHKEKIIDPDGTERIVTTPQEKGIDVRLALDLVARARKREFQVAVIYSQDQDLSELVQEVKDIGRTASLDHSSVRLSGWTERKHPSWYRQDRLDRDARDQAFYERLIPSTQVALDVVCREVGRVRSPGRTPDG